MITAEALLADRNRLARNEACLREALESILRIPNSEAAQGIMKCFARAALEDLEDDE